MTAPKPDSPKPGMVERIANFVCTVERGLDLDMAKAHASTLIAAELAPLLDAVGELCWEAGTAARILQKEGYANYTTKLDAALERVKKEMPS